MKLKVAFDVDDTLVVPSVATMGEGDRPNMDTISLFRWFERQGHNMIIWSGGGVDYARGWAERLGLNAEILPKFAGQGVDICFDDCEVNLATVNVRVRRVKNSISRKEWNQHRRKV